MSNLITVKEAADLLGVSTKTIRRLKTVYCDLEAS
ncbi:MAG: DeoR family transcriptional regulator [Waterburya sp.]